MQTRIPPYVKGACTRDRKEGPLTAFVNDGHGHFSNATSSVFNGAAPAMEDRVRYLVLADFDGDGLRDCFITGTGEGAPADEDADRRVPEAAGREASVLRQAEGLGVKKP